MAANQILPFASSDILTNLLTQSEYQADAQRLIGNQPGVARSKLVNKVLKQTSLICAGLGQLVAASQPLDVTDNLTAAQFAEMLEASILAIIEASGADAPGMLASFATVVPPPGWLLCDGSAVSRVTYARLFARIGTIHGPGDGTTTFNLPDPRGRFLRVLDSGKGIDTSRLIGTTQSDQNKQHSHSATVNDPGHNHDINHNSESGSIGSNVAGSGLGDDSTDLTGNRVTGITVTIGNDGGNEARPTNIAFPVFIRF